MTIFHRRALLDERIKAAYDAYHSINSLDDHGIDYVMPHPKQNATNPEDNDETRHAILQVARRLFEELGYRAVSTRRIAELCGLTQPALYHHFANKQELYVAVHRETLSGLRPGLERIAKRNQDIGDCLGEIVRYLFANRGEAMGMMFHDLAHELDAEAQAEVRDLFRLNIVAPIASVFETGIKQGVLRDVDEGGVAPNAATYLLLSMIEGASMMHNPSGADGANSAFVVDVLLRGLGKFDDGDNEKT